MLKRYLLVFLLLISACSRNEVQDVTVESLIEEAFAEADSERFLQEESFVLCMRMLGFEDRSILKAQPITELPGSNEDEFGYGFAPLMVMTEGIDDRSEGIEESLESDTSVGTAFIDAETECTLDAGLVEPPKALDILDEILGEAEYKALGSAEVRDALDEWRSCMRFEGVPVDVREELPAAAEAALTGLLLSLEISAASSSAAGSSNGPQVSATNVDNIVAAFLTAETLADLAAQERVLFAIDVQCAETAGLTSVIRAAIDGELSDILRGN